MSCVWRYAGISSSRTADAITRTATTADASGGATGDECSTRNHMERTMNAIAVIRLIFAHADDIQKIPALIEDAKAIAAGPGWVADRLAPSKRILDVTFPIADELQDEIGKVQAMTPDEFTGAHLACRDKVKAVGVSYGDMLALAQLIWELIQFVRNLKNKPSADGTNDLA